MLGQHLERFFPLVRLGGRPNRLVVDLGIHGRPVLLHLPQEPVPTGRSVVKTRVRCSAWTAGVTGVMLCISFIVCVHQH